MRLGALIVVSLLVAGCASPQVSLDAYDGVYATHFDGIPDASRICARLTNHGDEHVDWVSLRLRSLNRFDGGRDRRTSFWTYGQSLAPGETAIVELVQPPVAAAARLSLHRAGRGDRPPRGRPVKTGESCSIDELVAETRAAMADRSAGGIDIVPLRRLGTPAGDQIAAD